ncbi:MAG: cyclodeaminase/cyclohydrolase family protein [Clostridia bacterium]|nr:cyclodeaminase/cyclohydrolase family protein [Clostridia bacterium]
MLVAKTVTGLIDELASSSPAPGGGSVAALSGALGAALGVMVCNLTIGKAKYEAVWAELEPVKKEAEQLQQRLLELIDIDTDSFNKVMAAFKLPKETNEEKKVRSEAIQSATIGAAEVPLEVALLCLKALRFTPMLAEKGNENAISDIGVAAQQAEAGIQGAALNVKINLGSIKDESYRQQAAAKVAEYLAEGQKIKEQVMDIVNSKL